MHSARTIERECEKNIWKKIMIKENAWDQKTEIGIVEGPVEEVSLEETIIATKKMKSGKASHLLEVGVEMINASRKVGIDVMMKLCQRIFDRKKMPEDWKTSVIVPIYKEKGDVTNCGAYRGVKLLEHGVKIVERVLG